MTAFEPGFADDVVTRTNASSTARTNWRVPGVADPGCGT
jgi:hypothetical protein